MDKIACSTEDVLWEITDPEEAYPILAERARKAVLSRRGQPPE